MKLLNFTAGAEQGIRFGLAVHDTAVTFSGLQRLCGTDYIQLANIKEYLAHLPESLQLAQELLVKAKDSLEDLSATEKFALGDVRILPPVPHPPALLDFALAPEHLRNSALTLLKYEKSWPMRTLMGAAVKLVFRKNRHNVDFRCYKGNHNAIIGDMDSTFWPGFTSYLDIEAELGIVVGHAPLHASAGDLEHAIAGYLIFNDFSARDVQWPELMGRLGMARCKDFERGNGIGPFLVTPDEIPDPLALDVSVKIGERSTWKGNTSGYIVHPTQVIEHVTSYQSLKPGTILGMGTVPRCCGLDRDDWILPGDLIVISFEKLGTLRQKIPDKIGPLEKSRWIDRPELQEFVGRT